MNFSSKKEESVPIQPSRVIAICFHAQYFFFFPQGSSRCFSSIPRTAMERPGSVFVSPFVHQLLYDECLSDRQQLHATDSRYTQQTVPTRNRQYLHATDSTYPQQTVATHNRLYLHTTDSTYTQQTIVTRNRQYLHATDVATHNRQ